MSLRKTHELHNRRFGRNLGLGLVLAGFVALIFAPLFRLLAATAIWTMFCFCSAGAMVVCTAVF